MSRTERVLSFLPLAAILLFGMILPAAVGFAGTVRSPEVLLAVVSDSEYRSAWRNLLTFALVAVPLELALGLAIAWLIRPTRWRAALRVLLLVPWLISPVANGVMWHFLFSRQSGLVSYLAAAAGAPGMPSPLAVPGTALAAAIATDVWRQAPLAAFLILPALISIPVERWEQADLEGASIYVRLTQIVLPALRPLLLMVTLLLFGLTAGNFDSVLVMTAGGPGSATVVPALYSYRKAFAQNDWPAGTASAWVIAGVVLLAGVLYIWLSRRERKTNRGVGLVAPLSHAQTAPQPDRIILLGWRTQERIRQLIRIFFLVLVVVVTFLPILWTLLASFNIKPQNLVSPPVWTIAPDLNNYLEVDVTEPGFMNEVWTGLGLSTLTMLLTTGFAFLFAYALARTPWRGRSLFVQTLLVLASVPVMGFILPLNALVKQLGLYDSITGVALAETAVLAPLAAFVLYGYMAQAPTEQEEAARVEGAGFFRVLRDAVWPSVSGGVAATAIVLFVLSWNQFLVPLSLSADHVRTVQFAMVDVFKWDRELEWSAVAAAFVVALLPLILLVTSAHRLLERFTLLPEGE
ncbi:MAG: ABC transporter permease subunit [Rudaea sp.]